MPDDARARLAAWSRRIASVNPLVVEARLHIVAPLALMVIAVLLIGGAVRPVERSIEDAGRLVTGAAEARYTALDARLVALNRQQGQAAASTSADERAVTAEMMRLAVGAKLRGCSENDGGVSCDGRGIGDTWIFLFYVFGGCFAVLGLLFWVATVYTTSWLLPYRNPSLWYTPVYGAAIALLTAGPLLMAAVYFERADADYQLAAARSSLPMPSPVLYVLLLLQATAVIVALIKARTPLSSIRRWVGAPAIALIAAAYAAMLASGPTWLILCAVLLGISLLLGPVRAMLTEPTDARGREHGPPRILQLSALLVIAWIVYAADVVIGVDGTVHAVLTALCLIACAAQVLMSHALELSYTPSPASEASPPAVL